MLQKHQTPTGAEARVCDDDDDDDDGGGDMDIRKKQHQFSSLRVPYLLFRGAADVFAAARHTLRSRTAARRNVLKFYPVK